MTTPPGPPPYGAQPPGPPYGGQPYNAPPPPGPPHGGQPYGGQPYGAPPPPGPPPHGGQPYGAPPPPGPPPHGGQPYGAPPPPGPPPYGAPPPPGSPPYGGQPYGGPPPAPMTVPRFFVKQRITVMVNRYEVLAANPDGSEGPLLALAEQRRLKLKEEVNFYADDRKTRPVFSFRARQRLDVHAEHDVFDEHGNVVGWFSKQFGASLLRSTWNLATPTLQARGQERRPVIAILRRIWTLIPYLGDIWVPFVFHFDFFDTATGAPVMTSERQKAIRDRYTVTVHDSRLDFRVAAAMAVALDALQSR